MHLHEVVFAVKQTGVDELGEILLAVSDPQSPSYGDFLSREEVARISINPASTEKTIAYLKENNFEIVNVTNYGEYITARARLNVIEVLLNANFYHFSIKNENDGSDQMLIRSTEYTMPIEIEEHVSDIFNTIQFPLNSVLSPSIREDNNTDINLSPHATSLGYVTPALLNSYYRIKNNTGFRTASQCVYAAVNQNFSPQDLSLFQQFYGIPKQPVASVTGGHNSSAMCNYKSSLCVEANLDVQFLMAVSQTTPTYFMYDNSTSDFLLSWVTSVANMKRPPLVNSISYAVYEAALSKSYIRVFDTEAIKLGLQGVSILAASGDDGAPGSLARTNPGYCGYWSLWPASSPYVTSVGGTQGPESGQSEVTCMSTAGGVITSGGGFSTLYSRPAWQNNAVNGYFSSLSAAQQPAAGYTAGGRGYPDVSALAFNYRIIIGGR